MMPLDLKDALGYFSRILIATFKEFIHKLLDVCLNEWTMFHIIKQDVQLLWFVLDKCR